MSLGKAMIHARKQKSIARAAALAGEQATAQSAHILQMPVLVLNASYEPINICGARRALVLVLKGVARTEEEHGLTLHAQRSRMAMPSVIRLLEYRRIPYQTRACCHGCNRRKGNRMLHELDDMVLLREPRPFSLHTSRQIMRMLGRGDDRWRKYLFY